MVAFPDADWDVGDIADPSDWVDQLLSLPQSGRLSMSVLALRTFIRLVHPLLPFFDAEDGAGDDDIDAEDKAGDNDDASRESSADDANNLDQTAVMPTEREAMGPSRYSEAPTERPPAAATVESKGKTRAVETVQSVDEGPSLASESKATEPTIVVKRAKVSEAAPEPEDLEEYSSTGELLVSNDPVVSFELFSFFVALFNEGAFVV
jgi:hypothetical protein